MKIIRTLYNFAEYKCTKPQLEILVVPEELTSIAVYWNIETIEKDDVISLYQDWNLTENMDNVVATIAVHKTSGVSMNRPLLTIYPVPEEKEYLAEERRLGYFAVYWRTIEGNETGKTDETILFIKSSEQF